MIERLVKEIKMCIRDRYYLPQSGVLEIAPKKLIVESDSPYESEVTCSRIGEAASPVTDVIRITQTGAYIVEYLSLIHI